ncbi:hypothetical protein BGZ80_011181 [Entomortierella chlamydospora]|uniref:Uncharacterized protein n=1 Tax=Entomortierella chlamydospora TaxID=101097 RepID=A0A9P6N3Y8_9FUNG|nr:hypothetical protein BGZ79_008583 [Entomortierella chlamydospora]KAG0022771.1 hypothetical protein BGZ80_011181 [Entomortierella chlamydospora]
MSQSSERLRYYVEYHSKINSITLSVQVTNSGLTCTIGPQAIDLIPVNLHRQDAAATSETHSERIVLPARVMPTRTTLDPSSSQSSLLTLKLTALPNAPLSSLSTLSLTSTSASEFPPAPLPAAQLQGLENIACGCCGNVLLKRDNNINSQGNGPIQRVVDLPSEHWQELVDCWMCHEEDFTELREGDLGARLGQALVGGSYILIHAANVDLGTVAIEEDACAIDLWMLNWDSTIITNQKPVNDSQIAWDTSLQSDLCASVTSIHSTIEHERGKKVMKVLYLEAPVEEQEVNMREGSCPKEVALWDRWRGDPGVERLQFNKELLLGLLTMLEQSSSCQPPTLNGAASAVLAMDGMRVGFIET